MKDKGNVYFLQNGHIAFKTPNPASFLLVKASPELCL